MAIPLKQITPEIYARLSRRQRKALLESNRGIFRKVPPYPSDTGPTITEAGHLRQADGGVESYHFVRHASALQANFYEKLADVNTVIALEYALAMTSSLTIWKEDMKLLQLALTYLEVEEKALRETEHTMEVIRFPEVLKRHFPGIFGEVVLEGLSLREMLQRIKIMETTVKRIEKELREYLAGKRAQMPFLFENG